MLFPRPASDPITVGPYTLTQLIGQGGMAVVYKAKRNGPAGFEKTVVVKAMLPGLISRKELVDLFRAEAKLSAQLNHPNIVQVHDFGISDGVPFLVMEFLNGRNLTQLRAALGGQGGKLPVGAALAIARDVCHALAYAHDFVDSEGNRRQIIHRDVSPSNVMVCRDGGVKLLDFGVAKVAGQFDCDVTQSFRGKYAYMAPEQVNRQAIDRRVDVFAAGIVLHEMLTGKRLFAASSELETLERVSQAKVVAPSVDNRDVPRKLDALVKRALARDPQARFASGAEMAEALDALNGLVWSRKKLQSWLAALFPGAWSITCEVCGKQVPPGDECQECGTEAPSETGQLSLPALPSMPSEPLPLPPPPGATAPRLRVVKSEPQPDPFEVFERPSMVDSMAAFTPVPETSNAFEAVSVDRTPVERVSQASTAADGAPTWLLPLEPQALGPCCNDTKPTLVPPSSSDYIEPASAPPPPAARLFVVPNAATSRTDDSVRMGLHKATPSRSQPVLAPSLSKSAGITRIEPTFIATHPALRAGAQTPPSMGATPDLRKKSPGLGLFLAVLAAAGLIGIGVSYYLHSAPVKGVEPGRVGLRPAARAEAHADALDLHRSGDRYCDPPCAGRRAGPPAPRASPRRHGRSHAVRAGPAEGHDP